MFCSFIQTIAVAKQHICITGNGAKRSPKIVRDCPKKVCPKLLIFCQNCIFLFFHGILCVFHCKCAFIYYRQQDAVFKRVQCFFLQRYPNYTVNIIAASDCQIQTFGLRKMVCGCTGTLSVFICPSGCLLFLRCQKIFRALFFPGEKLSR